MFIANLKAPEGIIFLHIYFCVLSYTQIIPEN